MTVTTATTDKALAILRNACGGLRDATGDVWAAVINSAPLTVTDERGNRTPIRSATGEPLPLNPGDDEVLPAALSIAGLGMHFIQAADLAAAIQDSRDGNRAARRARIQADVQANGLLIPEGLGTDIGAELAWRRAATAAIGAGATREQAETHAWRSIGRTPPAALPTRDRSAEVRRLIGTQSDYVRAEPA